MGSYRANSPHNVGVYNREKWMAEYERWNNLTDEEQDREYEELRIKRQQREQERLEKKEREREERNLAAAEHTYVYADTTNTMENSEATILWVVVMIVGSIFKGNWMIWIVATLIWWNFINRYAIRKAKWDNGGKEEYFQKIKDACKGDKK